MIEKCALEGDNSRFAEDVRCYMVSGTFSQGRQRSIRNSVARGRQKNANQGRHALDELLGPTRQTSENIASGDFLEGKEAAPQDIRESVNVCVWHTRTGKRTDGDEEVGTRGDGERRPAQSVAKGLKGLRAAFEGDKSVQR